MGNSSGPSRLALLPLSPIGCKCGVCGASGQVHVKLLSPTYVRFAAASRSTISVFHYHYMAPSSVKPFSLLPRNFQLFFIIT